MRPRAELPAEVEDYRDLRWRREGTRQVETAYEAERFIEQAGFIACLSDSRRPGPSLYVAVCGRRDAVMPRNVQKDPEASLTWVLKDEIVRRGRVYYAKLARGKAMFLAPQLIPYFHAVWGIRRTDENRRLSKNARSILRILRREWEMSTADLRLDSGVTSRAAFGKALDELQAAMIVVPSQVVYQPSFTYLWTLAVGRFPDALRRRVGREIALREIARAFLDSAGMTIPGELARVTGLSRPDAGRGNRALVTEGYAAMLAPGMYRLASDLAVARAEPGDSRSREKRTTMTDERQLSTVERFSERASDYVKYRPSYPAGAIQVILAGLGPPDRLVIADVGAGTGISARLLGDRGVRVLAVEPGEAMRRAAAPHPNVSWVVGMAEATGLSAESVDAVLCAQSFHWFEAPKTLIEFARILKPAGRLAIMWNRRSASDALTGGYRQAILDVGGEVTAEKMPFDPEVVPRSGLFSPVERTTFDNAQRLDLEGLIGRARSASYVPTSGEAAERLLALLRALHARYADSAGIVTLVYETEIYRAVKL